MGEMKQKTHKKQEELTYVPSISSFTLCFEEAMQLKRMKPLYTNTYTHTAEVKEENEMKMETKKAKQKKRDKEVKTGKTNQQNIRTTETTETKKTKTVNENYHIAIV